MIGQWYEQYSGELTRYVRSKGFTPEDAEDICGTVFLEAVRAQPADTAPRAWLYLVARNRIIERWRREGRQRLVSLEEWHDPAVEMPEIAEPLSVPLDCLTTEQKAVIQARFVEDRSIEETAALLGVKPGAVRARQHRAMERLRTASGKPLVRADVPTAPPPLPDPLCANGDGALAFVRLNRRALCASCALLWLMPHEAPPTQDDLCALCAALGYVRIRGVVLCAACVLNPPPAPRGKFRRYPASNPPMWAE